MRLVLRAFAMVAAFLWSTGCRCHAEVVAAHAQRIEMSFQRWTHWEMNEIERQCYPKPRMLAYYRFPERDLLGPEPTDGPLKVMAVFKVADAYNQELLMMWGLGLLNTEACIPPSKTQPVYVGAHRSPGAFIYWFSYEFAKLWGLSPSHENRELIPWRRNIRAFSSIASISFCTAQFEEANPFKLNTPSRLSEYGDDLRLFEHSLRFTTDNPFDSYLDLFGSRWPLLFSRWTPLDLDEMFSTPLLQSR